MNSVILLLTISAIGQKEPTPPYERHVVPIFSRLGCNGGTCHGAVQGQNGFKLSLFGADTALDHERLLRESAGRRINLLDPDASLILLKATGRVSHQGGKRCDVGSFEYKVLRDWIAAGALAETPEKSRVVSLQVTPDEKVVRPDESYQLRIEARFADNSVEDVTRYCSFTSLNDQIAQVDGAGKVQGLGVGDTALMVRYGSTPAVALVLVPRPGPASNPVKGFNSIDDHILNKLQRINLPSSPLADDATFLRRAFLDVIGALPEPDAIRAFLEDRDPKKRDKIIEKLLLHPGHAALWTMKFCDLLKASDYGVYADALTKEMDAPRFQAWIRARLEENLPYDQLAERILLATSREGRSAEEYSKEVVELMEGYGPGRKDVELYQKRRTLDLYWQRRGAEGVTGALQVAHAFLGLRLECAQCHRHPHDVWQQDDFLSFANFFMRVRRVGFQGDTEKKFPDKAAVEKKLGQEAKALEQKVKKLKDTEAKKHDEQAKKAKSEAGMLTADIARLEKQIEQAKSKNDPKLDEWQKQLAQKRTALKERNEIVERGEKFRQDLARMEKRSKNLVEAARRFMHGEAFLLPAGAFATVTNPLGTQTSKQFRLLGESKELKAPADQDPRAAVVAWMRRPDNPFFARAIVNRVWAHYFGRGIIDPPDNLSPFNPATHPELLKELCDGFIRSKYDLRWLHRTILQSRTYQQSSIAGKDNAADRGKNYAYFSFRRLPAEVLIDALNQATGVSENMDMKYYHWPDEIKTVDVPYMPKNAFVTFMLESFGKPGRNSAAQCDCERDASASVFQVLTLANHPRIWEKIADPKGRVARILKEKADEADRLDEIFLATVSRLPDERDRQACRQFLESAASPTEGYQGILWGLLNTREFLLQH